MARNLIGTVTTDSNGEATFSYVGGGLGRIGFSAEHGTFQSEIYGVLDATFLDRGTSNDYGTWTSSDFTDSSRISRNDEYTTLTPQDNFDRQQQSITGTDFAVELDCNLTYSDGTNINSFLRVIASTIRAFYPDNLGLTTGGWHHIKFIVQDGNVTPIVDGETKTSLSIDSVTAFSIVLNNNYVSNMKYKNFVVYPI